MHGKDIESTTAAPSVRLPRSKVKRMTFEKWVRNGASLRGEREVQGLEWHQPVEDLLAAMPGPAEKDQVR